jgi:pimeloyl-ACP methyl ester carboxylesterase
VTAVYRSTAGEQAVRQRYLELLDEWPVAAQRLLLPTREGETFVLACGPHDAPPVLALQGSGANTAMWLGQIGAWARSLRVYAVDVIGEPGLSAPSRPPLTGDAYAGWLDDVLDGLDLPATALMGVSLGGWLVLDYAIRRPDRVTRLVLLNPSGIGRRKLATPVAAGLLSLFGARGRRLGLVLALGPVARRAPATPEAARTSAAVAAIASLVFKHFKPRLGAIPRFDDAALRRLAMPVLAVVGEQDAMLDARQTIRRLAQTAPHAIIHALPDAGHLLPTEAGPVLDFLRSN